MAVHCDTAPGSYSLMGGITCCHLLLQDVRALAMCCCKAAKLLHQAGIVHSDIRLDNVAQVGKHCYMLLDLESVAAADAGALPHGCSFACWDDVVLDCQNCFTTLSDMHVIGELLSYVMRMRRECIVPSAAAKIFVQKLVYKQLSASAALSDPWLA